jgi:indole-3-glycerol phosphate synthase
MAVTYLDAIVARHRKAAAADERSLDELLRQCGSLPPSRSFREALASRSTLGVIAEIKRRSPSKGDLNVGLDPAAWASAYERGGAACLSVLTDEESFGGSADDLHAARAACSVPVLRKDFTVSPKDVVDTRLMGADCVLLIAAALERDELMRLHRLAVYVGLDVLVEIHDEVELDTALAANAEMIGVNQRDLVTFDVDHERAERMAGLIPSGVVRVAESGVRGADDARRLEEAGYAAVLVGETLVTDDDPAAVIRLLIGD